MSVRFCANCEAEVEVSQGSCLLGHAVSLQPMNSSLNELRAEVDKAFADAELQVAAVLAAPPPADAALMVSATTQAPESSLPPPGHPGVHRMPPPPPPLTTTAQMAAGLAMVDAPRPSGNDPISEFAPPPRMDWGPDKGVKRSLLRRRSG